MVDRLHPQLQQVLQASGWAALTQAQEAAWAPIVAGGHVLLVAPTGHGKTEAALLPVLHRLLAAREDLERRNKPWPTGFKALYITPLRALNRDLLGRLESWSEALALTIGVRHGDTKPAERARQSRNPPDILITTPETLQLLFYGDRLRAHLATVRFVVVDEIHDLAASERGSQLTVALERLEEAVARPGTGPAKERRCPSAPAARAEGMFQRIGLSATIAEPDAIARFLAGSDRAVAAVVADAPKKRTLHVVAPDIDEAAHQMAAELSLTPAAAAELRTVRRLVERHAQVLVFVNTRDSAELLVNRSHLLDEEAGDEDLLGLHHGSLSSEHRASVEDAFKQGRLRGLVATSSLELGIDVGTIDHVVQVHSPRSVARLMQRLGRAGHRVGAVSEGTMVSMDAEDHLECLAIAARAEEGVLEPIVVREAPLVVLANQIVALSNEYAQLNPEWTLAVLRRAAPFAELDEGLFQQTWDTLLDVATLFEGEPGRIARSGRARKHFLDHISLIPDRVTYRVLDEATKRSVGTVDDEFIVAGLYPGAAFVMAGRNWRVLEVDADARRVRVAHARDVAGAPQWAGSMLPVSREVAQAAAAMRGNSPDGLGAAAGPILAQVGADLQVPTDRLVTLETGFQSIIVNVALGTRGNETLGRLTAAFVQQRTGFPVALETDAYHLRLRTRARPDDVLAAWSDLDPDTLDVLLGLVLKDQPVVRQHLVHVAKQFGALPKQLDPTRTTKKKVQELWNRFALQEETLQRLIHDRFDLEAVGEFLRALEAGAIETVVQGLGPISRLGERQHMIAPRSDKRLLDEVRRRIEGTVVWLVCTNCRTKTETVAGDVPRMVHCRRCQSKHVACLRPWDEEHLGLLGRPPSQLRGEAAAKAKSMHANGALMASFGSIAARALCGRGVGPSGATRILQKSADIESPDFWREILQAELDFARTSAFWRK